MVESVTVKIDPGPINALARKGRSLAPVLNEIGRYLVGLSVKAFNEQQWQGARWIARSVPNLPGVVRDLEQGPSIQSKRFQSRPALMDTGALKKSVEYKVKGSHAIDVYSNSPYAALHQKGGPYRIPVSQRVRDNLRIVLKEAGASGPIAEYKTKLSTLLARSELTGEVPARQFLGPPKDANEVFGKIIAAYLNPSQDAAGYLRKT